tara:strand:- start:276 stop:524 length:249 start_codon:yes stop_codon:yes gene_type:complete
MDGRTLHNKLTIKSIYMPNKKRKPHQKMDKNFVSSQPWEIQWIADKFSVSPSSVRAIKARVGVSRRRIYSYIRSSNSSILIK